MYQAFTCPDTKSGPILACLRYRSRLSIRVHSLSRSTRSRSTRSRSRSTSAVLKVRHAGNENPPQPLKKVKVKYRAELITTHWYSRRAFEDKVVQLRLDCYVYQAPPRNAKARLKHPGPLDVIRIQSRKEDCVAGVKSMKTRKTVFHACYVW